MSCFPSPIIILCSSPAHGGAELAAANLAIWLKERGTPCLALGMPASPFLVRAAAKGVDVGEIHGSSVWAIARTLRRALRRSGATAVLTNGSPDLHASALLKQLGTHTALLHFQHMQIGIAKRDPLHWLEQRMIDAWIAPLPWLARQTRERTRIRLERIHVIPHGVDLTRFLDPGVTPEQARAALQLPPTALLAGMVGRFDHGKGQEHLLRAVQLLSQNGLDAHAVLVGEETRNERQGYREKLDSIVEEARIRDRVHFRPFRDDIQLAYRAFDLFALTSISETYGLVTIEAMASSLPVVGTRSAGTPEIIEHHVNGLLVPPADAPALAAALAALSRDPALCAALGAQAKQDALRFSHLRQVEAVEGLLQAVAR